MRIFVGPVEVAGVAEGIRAGLREIGESADLVLSHHHKFSYGGNSEEPLLARLWAGLGDRFFASQGQGRRKRLPIWFLWKLCACCVLFWALFRYRAFIFIFGNTITNTRFETFLHKLLGKRLVFVHLGSDARPPFMDGQVCHEGLDVTADDLARRSRRISALIQRNEQAGVCITLPFIGQFHRRPYINSFFVGTARVLNDSAPGDTGPPGPADAAARGAVRILHSPSHPEIKGTQRIEQAIESLRAKGYDIDFELVKNASNAQVLAAIRRCDFVVDQVYSDMPLASFATEAAFYGKPAVVAGYAASHLPDRGQWPVAPSLFVHPERLESAIEHLIANVEARSELGRRARAFVRSEWSIAKVAGRIMRIIRDEIPDEWWIEPAEVRYIQGCGLAEERCREVAAFLVRERGLSALCLPTPELDAAMLEFIGKSPLEVRAAVREAAGG